LDPGKGQNCTKDRLACAVHLFSVLKNQACCRKQGRIEIRGSDESLSIDLQKTFCGYYYCNRSQFQGSTFSVRDKDKIEGPKFL